MTNKGKIYRIHGDNDLIIPKPIVGINTLNGGHLIILDKSDEISDLINENLDKTILANS